MDGPHGRSGSRLSRASRTVRKTRAKSPFEVLGLDPRSSTKQEARQRYRELMKRYHPDVASETGAEGRATEINLAYEAVLRGWEDLGGEASGGADGLGGATSSTMALASLSASPTTSVLAAQEARAWATYLDQSLP